MSQTRCQPSSNEAARLTATPLVRTGQTGWPSSGWLAFSMILTEFLLDTVVLWFCSSKSIWRIVGVNWIFLALPSPYSHIHLIWLDWLGFAGFPSIYFSQNSVLLASSLVLYTLTRNYNVLRKLIDLNQLMQYFLIISCFFFGNYRSLHTFRRFYCVAGRVWFLVDVVGRDRKRQQPWRISQKVRESEREIKEKKERKMWVGPLSRLTVDH